MYCCSDWYIYTQLVEGRRVMLLQHPAWPGWHLLLLYISDSMYHTILYEWYSWYSSKVVGKIHVKNGKYNHHSWEQSARRRRKKQWASPTSCAGVHLASTPKKSMLFLFELRSRDPVAWSKQSIRAFGHARPQKQERDKRERREERGERRGEKRAGTSQLPPIFSTMGSHPYIRQNHP